MNITIRPFKGVAALRLAPSLPLTSLALILWMGGQSAQAQLKYWNGSGNGAAGVWTTSNTWWSMDPEGKIVASSGVYGGDVAVFSTNAVGSPQISQLGGNLQAAAMRFLNESTTELVSGKGNHSLKLFGGITMDKGAGAVTLGASKGNRLTLNQQPNHFWTNHSDSRFTIENEVAFDGTYGQHDINGSGDVVVNGAISGSGTQLKKSGSGTLFLNGENTHTGDLTISSGALAGSGKVAANTVIGNGAIHSAGAVGGVGTQSFEQSKKESSTLTYEKGSIFSWDLDPTKKQTGGVGYDTVQVGGKLGSTNGAIFRVVIGEGTFEDVFWDTARVWDDIFADGKSAVSGWADIFSGTMQYQTAAGNALSPMGHGAFSLQGNTLAWTPEASFLPEPSTALAGLLLGAGLLRRRRPASTNR